MSKTKISTPGKLRAVREKLGLTQPQLAEKLGMTRDGIAKMESGERPISRVTQLAIEHLSCAENHAPCSSSITVRLSASGDTAPRQAFS